LDRHDEALLQNLEHRGGQRTAETFEIKGWVRTLRSQKAFAFLELYDGSCMTGLQVVVREDTEGYELVEDGRITTGCSVAAAGKLMESPGGKQSLELQASRLRLIGKLISATHMCKINFDGTLTDVHVICAQ
jgi:asparaginyl-tRNA synthetase